MDLVLLVAQISLVVLLVVIPVFSGYDKFRSWSPQRKLAALAIALALSMVAFSQYRRVVSLSKGGLPNILTELQHANSRTPWYARQVALTAWEYGGSVLGGAVLLAMSIRSAQASRWGAAAGWAAMFLGTVGLMVFLKLGFWHRG